MTETPSPFLRLVGRIFAALVLALLIVGGIAAYDAWKFLTTPAEQKGRSVIITIEKGATFDKVANDLLQAGIITDTLRFTLLGYWQKAHSSIRAGEYVVNSGWLPTEVLYKLTHGQPNLYRLVLREGLTWWETAKEVEQQGFAKAEDFITVVRDPAFLRAHAIPFDTAEGFLFPDTYLLGKPKIFDRRQAEKIASMLITTFWKKSTHLWTTLPVTQNLSGKTDYGHAVRGIGLPETPPAPPKTSNATSFANTTPAQNATTQPAENRANATLAAPNATASTVNAAIATVNATASTTNATVAATSVNATIASQNASPSSAATAQTASSAPAQPMRPKHPGHIQAEALREMVILASLVERETGVPEERARVAGVYANRIRLGMLLQCDPTIIYGVGPEFSGSIRRSQLQDASNLYNTYIHPGLPPGPISSFGLSALEGAFAPENHKYLFFVAKGDAPGHTFSKTLEEHNRAVRKYRATQK